jgi:soluble lytic murein transglycosylase-like protein
LKEFGQKRLQKTFFEACLHSVRPIMCESSVKRLSILVVALLSVASAQAQDTEANPASDYRLNPDKNTAYRLVNTADRKASTGNNESVISAKLADKPYAALIHKAARDTALDPALVHAVIFVESAYNSSARSPKGAIGLMQLLPATAARYGVRDPGRSPEANLKAGTRYLSDLMQQFDGRLDLVLAAYNAGENAVVSHGLKVPPYPETKRYVPAVLAKYHEWEEALPAVVSQYQLDLRLKK